MSNEQSSLSYEQMTALADRGLAPKEGDVSEAIPMDRAREIDSDVRRTKFQGWILEEIKANEENKGFGFIEPPELLTERQELVSWVAGRSEKELGDEGLLKEFRARWDEYQGKLVKQVPMQEPHRTMIPMLVAVDFFISLQWNLNAQNELAQLVIACDALEDSGIIDGRADQSVYFQLLGLCLLIDGKLESMFERFKRDAPKRDGEVLGPLDFGYEVFAYGKQSLDTGEDIYSMIEVGIRELQRSLAMVT